MSSRRGPSGRIASCTPDAQEVNVYGYNNEDTRQTTPKPTTSTSPTIPPPFHSPATPSSLLSPSTSSVSSVDSKQGTPMEKKLRKPKSDPKPVTVASPKTQEPKTDPKPSPLAQEPKITAAKPACDPRLTVKAPEFVPKTAVTFATPSQHNTQDLPNRMQDMNLTQSSSPEPEFCPEEDIHPLVTYLNDMIYTMTLQPGRFEPIAQRIISTINRNHVVTEVLEAIADTICVQSIHEPNFCYNGSRLCELLSQQLVTNCEDSFRQLILKRCHSEHTRIREELILHSPDHVQGFAMFMGELFLHLELQTTNVLGTHRIVILGRSLVELLMTLIASREQNNLKCACQVLKFTGATLEDEERAVKQGLAPSMDSLIEKLKAAALESAVPRNTKELMLKIVELRASDWGRVITSPVVLADPVMAEYPTDPFYGIPELEDADAFNFDGFESDEDEWCLNGGEGMDDEMSLAFEEFLRGSK